MGLRGGPSRPAVHYDTLMARTGATSALVLLLIAAAAPADAQLRTRIHVSGVAAPLAFVQDPVDRTIQYVVEQAGRIRVVRNGSVLTTSFLDLTASVRSGGEQGLLGLAFAPDHATSGRFYVNFTNQAGHTVVARFRKSANDPLVADASSRFDLRWGGAASPAFIEQPFANHNGGHLAFGPDGFLYVGMGDGGSGNDPQHRAQNPAELLGKMLRIDVNVALTHPSGYIVPSSNPFIGGPATTRPEIWSFGLRNPWRYNFDDVARGGTGALVIADVGQNALEEIDYEPRGRGGRNYGWRNREGTRNNVTSLPPAYQPLTDPIHEYDRSLGQSITGGFIYRGAALPAYQGRYFFADYVQGRVWSIAVTVEATGEARASDRRDHTAELATAGAIGNVSSFGVDSDGELYLVSYSRGTIFKVIGAASAPPAPSNPRIVRP